jgi:hypothetical protein
LNAAWEPMLGSCKWSLTLFLHDIPSWANPCHLHQTKKVRYEGQHLHIHIRLKHCCLHSYLTENCLKSPGTIQSSWTDALPDDKARTWSFLPPRLEHSM